MNLPQLVLDRMRGWKVDSVGHSWSFSKYAVIITFVGGPADGLSGMYDNHCDSFCFCNASLRQGYSYKRIGYTNKYGVDSVYNY